MRIYVLIFAATVPAGIFLAKGSLPPAVSGGAESIADQSGAERSRGGGDGVAEAPASARTLAGLRKLMGDRTAWAKESSKAEWVVQVFSDWSKEVGAEKAAMEAISLFSEGTLPKFERGLLLELSVLAIMRSPNAQIEAMAPVLKNCEEANALSVLRGAAFAGELHDANSIYGKLNQLFNPSITGTGRVRLLLNATVNAAVSVEAVEMARLADLVDRTGKGSFDLDIALVLSHRDRAQAIAFCLLRCKEDGRKLAGMAAALSLRASDLQRLTAQLSSRALESFVRTYMETMGKDGAERIAQALPAGRYGAQQKADIARALLRGPAGVLSSWLAGVPADEQKGVINQVYQDMMKAWEKNQSPLYMAEWLKMAANIPGAAPEHVADALMEAPTAVDPLVAQRLIATLPAGRQREVMETLYSTQITGNLVRKNGNVEAMLAAVPAEYKDALIDQVGISVGAMPSLAKTVLSEISDPTLVRAIEKGAVLSGDAPIEKRRQWFEEQLRDGKPLKEGSPAIENFLYDLALIKPGEVPAFFANVPDTSQKQSAIKALAQYWVKNDSVSASEWISKLPQGPARDVALAELISVATDDPERAIANSRAIGDAKLKSQALEKLANTWSKRDSQAFIDVVSVSHLSEQEKQSVLAKMNQ